MLANGRSLPVDICGAALNLRQMLGQLEMRGRIFHGWAMVVGYALRVSWDVVVRGKWSWEVSLGARALAQGTSREVGVQEGPATIRRRGA